MDHYEPPHQDLRCLQIQLFLPLVVKELTTLQVKDLFSLYVPETKIAEFANSVDLDEVAHNEPPHADLPCLPSCL